MVMRGGSFVFTELSLMMSQAETLKASHDSTKRWFIYVHVAKNWGAVLREEYLPPLTIYIYTYSPTDKK